MLHALLLFGSSLVFLEQVRSSSITWNQCTPLTQQWKQELGIRSMYTLTMWTSWISQVLCGPCLVVRLSWFPFSLAIISHFLGLCFHVHFLTFLDITSKCMTIMLHNTCTIVFSHLICMAINYSKKAGTLQNTLFTTHLSYNFVQGQLCSIYLGIYQPILVE